MTVQNSPFLAPASRTTDKTLALIALSRQSTIPTILRDASASDPTDEVTNTRFGSFPHSTLLDIPWGSQVRASDVSARDRKRGKKRKRGGDGEGEGDNKAIDIDDVPAFEAAASGFAHVLYPTPESWTYSLPHRTQVVYTPDYSYILQRLHVRPGDKIIEAGAGSGSFSHAAARAVFSGYPPSAKENGHAVKKNKKTRGYGKVLSFEYHEPRAQKLKEEIQEHGLEGIVQVTHRDVYNDGFATQNETTQEPQTADAIFLDLPAPWEALKNLTRDEPSVLSQDRTAMICTFNPCMEQVQKTIDAMREYGWIDIDMVEIVQRRIDVRRERVGLHEEGLRGVQPSPASVDEALDRLRENEAKQQRYHNHQRAMADLERKKAAAQKEGDEDAANAIKAKTNGKKEKSNTSAKQSRAEANKEALKDRKTFKEGLLVHRTEAEVKTHTSYLVFACLPIKWTAEQEAQEVEKWKVEEEKYKKEGVTIVNTKDSAEDTAARVKGKSTAAAAAAADGTEAGDAEGEEK